jgi:hypothetical protein
VVAVVDRFVCIDWVLLAASRLVTSVDAKSGSARGAGGHGVAQCVLPILSLVVLPWLACICRSAYCLLHDGGETGDMNDGNRSPPIAIYRHQAEVFGGRSDGKFGVLASKGLLFQVLLSAEDN